MQRKHTLRYALAQVFRRSIHAKGDRIADAIEHGTDYKYMRQLQGAVKKLSRDFVIVTTVSNKASPLMDDIAPDLVIFDEAAQCTMLEATPVFFCDPVKVREGRGCVHVCMGVSVCARVGVYVWMRMYVCVSAREAVRACVSECHPAHPRAGGVFR